MDNSKKKILLIAMGNSIHTVRWVSLFSDLDCEIYLFSSFTIPFVAYDAQYASKIKLYNFDPQAKKYLKAFLRSPFKYIKTALRFNLDALKASLAPAVKEYEVSQLAKLINGNDFALIHTLHTQTSAALLDAALPYLKKECPKWINTVWGSDLYLHQWVTSSRSQLENLLPKFDYYWGEGRRDYDLAKKLGFKGQFLPPVPAFGGFDMQQMSEIAYVKPSTRKRILVKGYQNVVGRASVAFRALELCADLLVGYEIDLFSYESQVVPVIASIFSEKYGIKVNCVSGVPYNDILKMHSSSRLCIALSTSDGLPASFIESMACGEFPIQSNTSMGSEWAEDGKTAFFVSPEESDEVARAIRKALTDDKLVDCAGELNRQTVRRNLDNIKMKEKVYSIYDGMINGTPLVDPTPDSKTMLEELTDNKIDEPLVSVITISYAHEKFIAQALEGIVCQKTNFKFELIIGDDHSPDGTASIIQKYAQDYPDIICPVLRERNIGALPNLLDLIARSKGKYVAICDGDDYWTDPLKLQKQVNFLESHPEYSVCCHPVRQFFEDGSHPDQILNPLTLSGEEARQRGYLTIHDLIKLNTVSSLSTMYRWQIPRILPDWMKKYKVGDYPLLLFHADKGYIGVLTEVMGAYRKHSGGSWWDHHTTKEQVLAHLSLLNDINKQLDGRYQKDFNPIFAHITTVDIPEFAENNKTDEQSCSSISKEEIAQIMQKITIKTKFKCIAKKIVKKIMTLFLPGQIRERLLMVYRLPKINYLRDAQIESLQHSFIQIKDELRSAELQLDQRLEQLRLEQYSHDRSLQIYGNKVNLLWDGVKYILQKQQDNCDKDFKTALAYYIATGNFNEFDYNYDKIFSDEAQVEKWISSVRQDFTKTVKACTEQISGAEQEGLNNFYDWLSSAESKDLLVRLVAWRILGFTKVKILLDDDVAAELDFYEKAHQLELPQHQTISDVKFNLKCYNLSELGYPIRCFAVPVSIVMDFIRLQYENEFVKIEKGDVVLDCGACWGDTALLFAERCGLNGKVYSFEFVGSNIQIFNRNLELNPDLAPAIELVPHPVSDESGISIPVIDNGTASNITSAAVDLETEEAVAETISIDDFVKQKNLTRLDFIKMDIEGAEISALMGAKESIARFLPKLAIAIYHKPDDLWQIPLLIKNIHPGYSFYIKHNSRSSLETVLLAKANTEPRGEHL
jgi:FkbM family methyltransferase